MICRMSWSCLRSSPCLKITGYMAPSSALKISLAGIRALWHTPREKTHYWCVAQILVHRSAWNITLFSVFLASVEEKMRKWCMRMRSCLLLLFSYSTLKSVAVSGTMPLILIWGSRGRGIGSISDRFTFSLSASRAWSRSVCRHTGRTLLFTWLSRISVFMLRFVSMRTLNNPLERIAQQNKGTQTSKF